MCGMYGLLIENKGFSTNVKRGTCMGRMVCTPPAEKILQKIIDEVSESFSPPGEGVPMDNLSAYHPSTDLVLRLVYVVPLVLTSTSDNGHYVQYHLVSALFCWSLTIPMVQCKVTRLW